MPRAHRNGDARYCLGSTIVQNQSTVFVNDKLWAVEGDPDSHGGGPLKAIFAPRNVYVEDKHVITSPAADTASGPDRLGHLPGGGGGGDDPNQASPDVWVYEGGTGGGTA